MVFNSWMMEKDSTPFEIKYYGEQSNKKTELTEEPFTDKIVSDVKGKDFEVTDVKKRERKQNRLLSLPQNFSRKLPISLVSQQRKP